MQRYACSIAPEQSRPWRLTESHTGLVQTHSSKKDKMIRQEKCAGMSPKIKKQWMNNRMRWLTHDGDAAHGDGQDSGALCGRVLGA